MSRHSKKVHTRHTKAQRAKQIGEYRIFRKKRAKRFKYLRRWHKEASAEVKQNQIRKKCGKEWLNLTMPSELCMINARNQTLSFFSEVQKAFDHPETKGIEIDHTTLQTIGIEAALLLTAQFHRMNRYAPNIVLRGKLAGMPPHIQTVLEGIGYLLFYPKNNLPTTSSTDTRYIRIKTGRGSDAQASGILVEAFRDEGFLDTQTATRLGKCLVECLDNVSQHAYAGTLKKSLKKRWWMVGYCDRNTAELYFAILDLGIGMPRSLRRRRREWRHGLVPLLFGLDDRELIVEAFTRGFSSTKKKYRGHGLPSLKKIIDKFGRGQLRVFSHHTECRLEPNRPPHGLTHKIPLEGTMLTWKLRPQVIISTPSTSDTSTFATQMAVSL
jgi:two-component sensor histidine kinase